MIRVPLIQNVEKIIRWDDVVSATDNTSLVVTANPYVSGTWYVVPSPLQLPITKTGIYKAHLHVYASFAPGDPASHITDVGFSNSNVAGSGILSQGFLGDNLGADEGAGQVIAHTESSFIDHWSEPFEMIAGQTLYIHIRTLFLAGSANGAMIFAGSLRQTFFKAYRVGERL